MRTETAFGAAGYAFRKRETPAMKGASEILFDDLLTDLSTKLYFSPVNDSDNMFLRFIFFRRPYGIVNTAPATAKTAGDDKVRRKKARSFRTEGGAGKVSRRIGEEGVWNTILPNAAGNTSHSGA